MTEEKPLEIVFSEGCFDNLPDDMTQEEIDEFKKAIEEKFLSMTPEDFESESRLLSDEEAEKILSIPPNTRQ